MRILDTNVVSELMREEPDGKVVGWAEAQAIGSLGVSVITLAEIGRGLNGCRRVGAGMGWRGALRNLWKRAFGEGCSHSMRLRRVATGSWLRGVRRPVCTSMPWT